MTTEKPFKSFVEGLKEIRKRRPLKQIHKDMDKINKEKLSQNEFEEILKEANRKHEKALKELE